jgi:hypothetical protein
MACDHSAPHSGALRYETDLAQLRLVIVCDECGAERAELGHLDYRPESQAMPAELLSPAPAGV